MRCAITRVLPEPGPARIRSAPSGYLDGAPLRVVQPLQHVSASAVIGPSRAGAGSDTWCREFGDGDPGGLMVRSLCWRLPQAGRAKERDVELP